MAKIEPTRMECLCFSVRKANRLITQFYDQHLQGTGIKITQLPLLRALHYFPGATMKQLEQRLVLDQTTLSRGLKPLIRDQYVRSESGEDKRQKHLYLTDEGKRIYAQINSIWEESQESLMNKIGLEDAAQLADLSRQVVKRLQPSLQDN